MTASPRLKGALAASLALNLFIVGAVVGAAGMQAREKHQKAVAAASRNIGNPLMRAAQILPEAKRNAYVASIKAQGEAAKADFAAARKARTEASALIGAPTYDLAAISARLAAARNSDMVARARFENAVITFAATLTPEERKALGERLKPQAPSDRGRDRGRDGGRGYGDNRPGDRPHGPPTGPKP